METMLSVRGKKLIVLDKYTFRKDKETALGVTYRCTQKQCAASVRVDKSEEVLLQRKNCHNHPWSENLDVKVIFFILLCINLLTAYKVFPFVIFTYFSSLFIIYCGIFVHLYVNFLKYNETIANSF